MKDLKGGYHVLDLTSMIISTNTTSLTSITDTTVLSQLLEICSGYATLPINKKLKPVMVSFWNDDNYKTTVMGELIQTDINQFSLQFKGYNDEFIDIFTELDFNSDSQQWYVYGCGYISHSLSHRVNLGITDGSIDLSLAPNTEFPMTKSGVTGYTLNVSIDGDYVLISESDDMFNILRKITGKYLYGYSGTTVVVKGLILACTNCDNIFANTLIPTDDLPEDVTWKIFDK